MIDWFLSTNVEGWIAIFLMLFVLLLAFCLSGKKNDESTPPENTLEKDTHTILPVLLRNEHRPRILLRVVSKYPVTVLVLDEEEREEFRKRRKVENYYKETGTYHNKEVRLPAQSSYYVVIMNEDKEKDTLFSYEIHHS